MVDWRTHTQARNSVPAWLKKRDTRKKTVRRKTTTRRATTKGRFNKGKKKKSQTGTMTKRYVDQRKLGQAIPLTLRNMMKYQDFQQHNTDPALYRYQFFRMNSIWDPDYSNVGSSTVMYNDMYRTYQRSRVNSCWFSHNCINKEDDAVRVYYVLQLGANPYGNPLAYDLTQAPGFLGYIDLMPGASGSLGMRKFKRKINVQYWLKKLLFPGPIPASFFTSDLWAISGGNPAQELMLAIYYITYTDESNHVFQMNMSCDMRYDVTWAQPNQVEISAFDNSHPLFSHGATGPGNTDLGATGGSGQVDGDGTAPP